MQERGTVWRVDVYWAYRIFWRKAKWRFSWPIETLKSWLTHFLHADATEDECSFLIFLHLLLVHKSAWQLVSMGRNGSAPRGWNQQRKRTWLCWPILKKTFLLKNISCSHHRKAESRSTSVLGSSWKARAAGVSSPHYQYIIYQLNCLIKILKTRQSITSS